MKTIINGLNAIAGNKLKCNEPLLKHTSFKIGGPAQYFVETDSMDKLKQLVIYANKKKLKYFIIGKGTNLLVPVTGISGIVVKLKGKFNEFSVNKTEMIAGPAVKLATLLKATVENNLSGLEFASGIPGSIGGAIVSNAGTALGSMKDIVSWVEIMDSCGRIKNHSAKKIKFSYRNCIIPAGAIITKACLTLRKAKKYDIISKIRSLTEIRRDTQPSGWNNAGSIFKNPAAGVSAGTLIDRAGLKGARVGNALVSSKHANFIINSGNASSADVLGLIKLIKKEVKTKFGIALQLEIKILGQDDK